MSCHPSRGQHANHITIVTGGRKIFCSGHLGRQRSSTIRIDVDRGYCRDPKVLSRALWFSKLSHGWHCNREKIWCTPPDTIFLTGRAAAACMCSQCFSGYDGVTVCFTGVSAVGCVLNVRYRLFADSYESIQRAQSGSFSR